MLLFTPSVASTISQKLDAKCIYPRQYKTRWITIRLNAQLVDSKTEEIFKSYELDGPYMAEMIVQNIDSLSINW